MKTKPAFKGMVCLFVLTVMVAGVLSLAAQDNQEKPKLLGIQGDVYLEVFPNNCILRMNLIITSDLHKAVISGLRVNLMGHAAKEEPFAGYYSCNINGFTPVVGAQVVITVEKNSKPYSESVTPIIFKRFQATATIGSLIEIIEPASEAHFNRGAHRSCPIFVSWRGGNPTYIAKIHRVNPGASYTDRIVWGNDTSVSFSCLDFLDGKHEVCVWASMENFKFSSGILPNSKVDFHQAACRYIYIE
jgi:hypothetical protein